MWHDLSDVSKEKMFNDNHFEKFALKHAEKYKIYSISKYNGKLSVLKVHTFYVDKLVEDYKKSNIIVDVEQECIKLIVQQKDDNLFDVIVDDVVRHPDCDCFAVMRALAHYLNSYAYSYDKLMKKTTE